MKISEARAVVTGGASGLGNAVARLVIANGGRAAMLDVQEGPGQAAAAELGASATFIRCDVTSEAEVNAAMESARQRLGGINLLVNCAGVGDEEVVTKDDIINCEIFAIMPLDSLT